MSAETTKHVLKTTVKILALFPMNLVAKEPNVKQLTTDRCANVFLSGQEILTLNVTNVSFFEIAI
jgi:hypothetical protein